MADDPPSSAPPTLRKSSTGLVRWDGLAALAREAAARFDAVPDAVRATEARSLATSFESWSIKEASHEVRVEQIALLHELMVACGLAKRGRVKR